VLLVINLQPPNKPLKKVSFFIDIFFLVYLLVILLLMFNIIPAKYIASRINNATIITLIFLPMGLFLISSALKIYHKRKDHE